MWLDESGVSLKGGEGAHFPQIKKKTYLLIIYYIMYTHKTTFDFMRPLLPHEIFLDPPLE